MRQHLIGVGISAGHLYEVERRARHLVAETEAHAKAMLAEEQPTPIREPQAWPAAS
jgi:pyruvate dehydrogenase E1 component alpha subunit